MFDRAPCLLAMHCPLRGSNRVLRLRHKSTHDSKRHAPDEGHDKEAACAAKRLRDQAEECGAHRGGPQ
jgi:hypothetical protein